MRRFLIRKGQSKMRQTKKNIMIWGIFLLAFSLLIAGCGGEKEDDENALEKPEPLDTTSKKVVIKYDDEEITEGEFNLYLNITLFTIPEAAFMLESPGVKEDIAKQYVAEKMIAKKVKDDKKFSEEADKMIADFEKSVKEESKKPADIYKEHGFKKEDLKNFLINSAKVRDYFESQIKEDDIKKEYEDSWEYYELKVNHILISIEDPEATDPDAKPLRTDEEAKKRAEEVKKKLEDGGDFEKLAKEYSDDPGSKDEGGLVEGLSSSFTPPFSQAAIKLSKNEISDPVKTDFGYHIIKLLEKKKQSYKDVKDDIKNRKVQEAYQDFLENEVKATITLPKEKSSKK